MDFGLSIWLDVREFNRVSDLVWFDLICLVFLFLLFRIHDWSFNTSCLSSYLSCLGLSPLGLLARDTLEPIERVLTLNSFFHRILFITCCRSTVKCTERFDRPFETMIRVNLLKNALKDKARFRFQGEAHIDPFSVAGLTGLVGLLLYLETWPRQLLDHIIFLLAFNR
jgi:hypothetical protein